MKQIEKVKTSQGQSESNPKIVTNLALNCHMTFIPTKIKQKKIF